MIVLSAAAAVAVLATIYLVWSRWPLDPVGLFCGSVVLFYLFRMVVVAFGVDPLYPDRLLAGSTQVATQTNSLVALFLAMVLVGLAPGSSLGPSLARVLPTSSNRPSLKRLTIAAAIGTACAGAVTAWLTVGYGGFAETVRAAKLDKELAGTFVFKVIPAVAGAVSVIAFLEARRRRLEPHGPSLLWRLALLGMALANGLSVLTWGARSVIVIIAFALLSGLVVFRPRRRRRGRTTPVMRLGLVVLLIVGIIFGLRLWRDVLLIGEVNQTIEDQSFVRQVSVGANTTQYDAFVLATRDWPSRFEFEGGEDFVTGAVNWVPRAIWAGKPETTVLGRKFRQVYDPERENGWPLGAAGEWYLDFGVAGVVVGGLLSGIALGIARRAYANSSTNVYGFVCSIIVAFQVLDGGWHSQTPTQWLAWCLPLLVVGWWVRDRSGTPAPEVSADDAGLAPGEDALPTPRPVR